jgi:hypothetical protein
MAILIFLICLLQSWSASATGLLGIPREFRREANETVSAPAACNDLASAVSVCNDYYPDLGDQPSTVQAECLCYDGTTWIPNVFDGWVATCASWARTDDPTEYTVVNSWAGLCTSVGDIYQTPNPSSTATIITSTPSPTKTPHIAASPTITAAPTASVDITVNAGCSFVSYALDFCSSAGSTLSADEVYCLCYSSTAWDPYPFDNAIATCANFVKTADPADYPIITSMESFCAIAGPLTLSAAPTASIAEPLTSNAAPTVTVVNPVHTTISGAATTPTGGAQQMFEPGVVNLGILSALFGVAGMVVALL